MPKSELPTINEAIKRALAKLNEPINTSDFYKKVLEIRPSSSKNANSSINNSLRYDFEGESIAYLDKRTIVPLRIAMPGVRFCIPISDQEANKKALVIDPSFHGFISRSNDIKTFDLVDKQGNLLPKKTISIKQRATGFLGDYDFDTKAIDLANWDQMKLAKPGDSFLVTIESWEPKRFRLELESKNERRSHNAEIIDKNKELADILFKMLEENASENIYIKESVISAYLRLSDLKGYPGDHWIDVIGKDSRMNFDGFSITYPEKRSFIEAFIDRAPRVTRHKVVSQQANQVYIFRAMFKYKTSIWRIIEIKGNQTLSQFDDILRDAFNHDSSDHLSGFWRKVRRGQTNRFREIELGDVDPFGGGDGADLKIAEIGINVGDKLKYVYDFGDWVEHEIILEAIEPPEAKVKYPRISEQNKPKYLYCENCKAKGKETIAVYICIECSNDKQREIYVCEECADHDHEEHYIDEITY